MRTQSRKFAPLFDCNAAKKRAKRRIYPAKKDINNFHYNLRAVFYLVEVLAWMGFCFPFPDITEAVDNSWARLKVKLSNWPGQQVGISHQVLMN